MMSLTSTHLASSCSNEEKTITFQHLRTQLTPHSHPHSLLQCHLTTTVNGLSTSTSQLIVIFRVAPLHLRFNFGTIGMCLAFI
jgi:hypothetical protein